MSKAWEGGSTSAWRKTRARILARDGGQCRLQLKGCTHRATQVHHVVGRGVSERDDDLVSACQPCNLLVGDPRDADPAPRPRTQW